MQSSPTYRLILPWMLLLIYFSGSLRSFQPYLDYNLNYAYISTVLCINKAKPQLECNGKCFLAKELKKTAEEESEKKETSVKLLVVEIASSESIQDFHNFSEIAGKINFPLFREAVNSVNPENTTPPPRA